MSDFPFCGRAISHIGGFCSVRVRAEPSLQDGRHEATADPGFHPGLADHVLSGLRRGGGVGGLDGSSLMSHKLCLVTFSPRRAVNGSVTVQFVVDWFLRLLIAGGQAGRLGWRSGRQSGGLSIEVDDGDGARWGVHAEASAVGVLTDVDGSMLLENGIICHWGTGGTFQSPKSISCCQITL